MRNILLLMCSILCCCQQREPLPEIEDTSPSTYTITEADAYDIQESPNTSEKPANLIHYFVVLSDTEASRDYNPNNLYISDIVTTEDEITPDLKYKYLDDYEKTLRDKIRLTLKPQPKLVLRELFAYNSYKTASIRRQEILNGDYSYFEGHTILPDDFNQN